MPRTTVRSRSSRSTGTSWIWSGSSSSLSCISSEKGRPMDVAHVAHHEEPNYIGVFWWLLALTILEIAVIYMPIAHMVIALLLIGLALTKAALGARDYMHRRLARGPLLMLAVPPLVLCVFLVFMLTPALGAVLRHSPKTEP